MPFAPFQVMTSTGAEDDITHPELLFPAEGLIIGIPGESGPDVPIQVIRIPKAHVAAVHDFLIVTGV